jgi:hypothetical protein
MPRPKLNKVEGEPNLYTDARGDFVVQTWRGHKVQRSQPFRKKEEALAYLDLLNKDQPANTGNRKPPPPPHGNVNGAKHGANMAIAPEAIDEEAERIWAVMPIKNEAFRGTVRTLADKLIRVRRIDAHASMADGDLTEKGQVKPGAKHREKLQASAMALGDKLGLNPEAWMRLGVYRELGASLAGVSSEDQTDPLVLFGGRNPVDFDSRQRRAAARILIAESPSELAEARACLDQLEAQGIPETIEGELVK